jgi:hypothetical protein
MAQFKPKSRFSAVSGKPKFRISKADWARIETAYGHPLPDAVRRKIRRLTREYLDWADFEPNAASAVAAWDTGKFDQAATDQP